MVNKTEQRISRIEREEETATYSVGTTLRTLHMQKNRQKQKWKRQEVHRIHETQRGKGKKRKIIKINRSLNYQIK